VKKLLAAVCCLAVTSLLLGSVDMEGKNSEGPSKQQPSQVIKNREVMKLFFDPYYVDLRRAAREEPQGRSDWRSLYVAAFRLSEVSNLLYFRSDKPYMNSAEWRRMATETRDRAAAVGQAVTKLDYPLVKKRYVHLIESCNACHEKFEPDKPTKIETW